MPLPSRVLAAAVWMMLPSSLHAFNGHEVTEGPLTLTIAPIADVTADGKPGEAVVTLANDSTRPLIARVWALPPAGDGTVENPARDGMEVPANGRTTLRFSFSMARRAVGGLYPLHVFAAFTDDGRLREAHAVRIFTALRADALARGGPAAPADAAAVPARGALSLVPLCPSRICYQIFDRPEAELPSGWTGSHPATGTSFGRGEIGRPEPVEALIVHPPWRGGAGTIWLEYHLRLPSATPLTFAFRQAVRDSTPNEGSSDGVTFRVRVDGKVVFERHSAATTWQPASVDLSGHAGKVITLGLECHPGPRRNTTCDSAYWGAPMVVAGQAPVPEPAADRLARERRARVAAITGEAVDGVFRFRLDGGCRAAVAPGPNGLTDAAFAFFLDGQCLVMTGVEACIGDQPVGTWPSTVMVESVATQIDGGLLLLRHHLRAGGDPAELTAEIRADGPGLRVAIRCNARLTRVQPGSFDRKAARVFYGHGYCMANPGPFVAHGGGHDLSTSHVGMDFDNGLSLLTACDTPPDTFVVDPARRRYALQTHPDTTFTFVPSSRGALDCAIRFRDIDPRRAAPGVPVKAGRFVFDLWGGRYADTAAKLGRCFQYGLTDSLALVHVWQRWGYDYRLPDIFPPDPGLGTVADLRGLGGLCARHGVRWGLHDNYIDIYPDCGGFSYDHVTFHPDGRPRTAWLNGGRGAQSYQFRPDQVRPFLARNLALIREHLAPTASFVDVWTSINAFDFHDREGRFHSKTTTLRHWAEGFDLIRETLGNQAPTISEAGADQLVGYLDGADCQFLRLAPEGREFVLGRPCADWERVPWLDAVLHSRFSLHGVGYSNRYQGGLPRELHGIESDDYLSAEMLTGHALMVDGPCLVRGAVRKYWLAQGIAAALRHDDIAAVDFAGSDIHRLVVSWKSGARVWVNRGTEDWTVEGRVLPPFGYLARAGGAESAVERIAGRVVERSGGPGFCYVNGRAHLPGAPLATDFGPAITGGGVRLAATGTDLIVTPLPDGPAFPLVLRPAAILRKSTATARVEALDATGKRLREVEFAPNRDRVSFTVQPGDFAYRVVGKAAGE